MSSDPSDNKSISGISLPQWMRRIENRFDLDGTPFSPPSHDESFFYIRYPIASKDDDKKKTTNANSLSHALQSHEIIKNPNLITTTNKSREHSQPIHAQKVDLSKHTESCKSFIGESKMVKGQKKSQGTDDGFKDAVCSSSILKVAHQVISGHKSIRNAGPGNFATAYVDDANVEPNDAISDLEDISQMKKHFNSTRRGSKSLPASPLSSPKSIRKNPYFTDNYATITAGDTEKRGWLMSALIGMQREAVPSTSTFSVHSHIEEEAEEVFENNNNVMAHDKKFPKVTDKKAKPTELREMNFWSPTSM